MARLPTPGKDSGTWGDVLNDFLNQVHTSGGTLKSGVVTSSVLASNAVTSSHIQAGAVTATQLASNAVSGSALAAGSIKATTLQTTNSPTSGQYLTYNSGGGFTWASGSGAPDADASTKGVMQLAGDLTGTAASPAVANNAITDAKVSSSASIAQSKIANLTTDLAAKAATTTSIGTSGSLTGGGNLSANRTLSLVNDSATPGNDKYYGTDGTGAKGFFDLPIGSGDPSVGGDLSGTASNAQLVAGAVGGTELASNAVTDAKVSGSANIAQSKIANLTTDLAAKATDTAVVHISGTETVTGDKDFSGAVTVATPTANGHPTTKVYVDGLIGGTDGLAVYSAGVYPLRTAVTASSARRVRWVGPTAPPIGSGYALEGDTWEKTP